MYPAETIDLLKGGIIIVCIHFSGVIDTSVLYHMIKSQSVIKLYLFFNMLEVIFKVLLTIYLSDNWDVFRSEIVFCQLLARTQWMPYSGLQQNHQRKSSFWNFPIVISNNVLWLNRRKRVDFPYLVLHFSLACIYVFLHAALVLLQATTINVAINASNKALFTIMMSNNVSFTHNFIGQLPHLKIFDLFYSLWNWRAPSSRNSTRTTCSRWAAATFGSDFISSHCSSLSSCKLWRNTGGRKVRQDILPSYV